MKKYLLIMFTIFLGIGIASSASAVPSVLGIDFRTGDWAVDGNQTEQFYDYSFGRVTASAFYGWNDVSGNFDWGPSPLWQDNTDGLGVKSPYGEEDEIEKLEWLVISLPMVNIEGFMITDLYRYPDGDPNNENGEQGIAYVKDSEGTIHPFDFTGTGDPSDRDDNGEFSWHFDRSITAVEVVFLDHAWLNYVNGTLPPEPTGNLPSGREFSVAGFYGPTPVPEPASLILLGTGFLGIALLGRRRIFKR